MICTPKLVGGLGNRLFTVCSVYGICRKMGRTLLLNPNLSDDNAHSKENYFQTVFARFPQGRCELQGAVRETELFKKNLHLYALERSKNYAIEGYLQSLEYFHEYRDELLHLLSTLSPPDKPFFKRTAFLHVRRGDYVNHWLHYVEFETYYKRAVKHVQKVFGDDVRIRIVCSDTAYLKKLIENLELNHYEVDMREDEVKVLSDMASCEYGGICGNSTFAWWGTYLNRSPSAISILPDTWFSRSQLAIDADVPDDLIQVNSTVLPVL